MADTANALPWIFFLFGGYRSTRRDPYKAIIIAATREGVARVIILFSFVQNKCLSFTARVDALTLR